jgi:dTDP-4-amino-4,6-dideoxygalactose transaminase
MKIPFRDLRVKDAAMRAELLAAVEKVLVHGRLILGPEVSQFEAEVAKYCGRRYAVGVNSGTDALYLALRALGVGPGDEVITTPLSWIATLNSIVLTGATPVFVDIKPDLNINEELIEAAITPKTKAIVPVHFTGRMCGMSRIMETAARHGVPVVEDAAQAFGSRLDGRVSGGFGLVGCFSMNPMKVFCAYGEAGAIVTDDEDIALRLESLRYNGTVNKEDCRWPSLNGRLDTVQAAMMLVGLKYLQKKIDGRRRISEFYDSVLGGVVGVPPHDGSYHSYYSYTITAERRDELLEYLASRGVETKIQHPILMPYHTAYKHLGGFHIPVAENLVKKILCIPNQEDLTAEELGYVSSCILEFYNGNKRESG